MGEIAIPPLRSCPSLPAGCFSQCFCLLFFRCSFAFSAEAKGPCTTFMIVNKPFLGPHYVCGFDVHQHDRSHSSLIKLFYVWMSIPQCFARMNLSPYSTLKQCVFSPLKHCFETHIVQAVYLPVHCCSFDALLWFWFHLLPSSSFVYTSCCSRERRPKRDKLHVRKQGDFQVSLSVLEGILKIICGWALILKGSWVSPPQAWKANNINEWMNFYSCPKRNVSSFIT